MEMRELLSQFGFNGDETPIIPGSALCALEGKKPEMGLEKIKELIKVIKNIWIGIVLVKKLFKISFKGCLIVLSCWTMQTLSYMKVMA